MIQIVEQTHEEKVKMYMKLSKRELIDMLIQCNILLENIGTPVQGFLELTQEEPSNCMHDNCSGCKNGTCSGIHSISCPCPKCTPTY